MATTRNPAVRQTWTAIRAMIVLTVVLGMLYPLVVFGVGQVAFPAQANGSLVRDDTARWSARRLIGQSFTDADGNPLPEWFQSRPSAAGDGYDGAASSRLQLRTRERGPDHRDRGAPSGRSKTSDGSRRTRSRRMPSRHPAPGLDPHISPAYALLQVPRIADARGLDEEEVRRLVEAHVQSRDLGYLGEPTVNVLQLNIALAELEG